MKTIESVVLYGKSISELEDFFIALDEPRYRAKQAFSRMYQILSEDFDSFTEFPIRLRDRLKEIVIWPKLKLLHSDLVACESKNKEETEKVIFEFEYLPSRSAKIESVWIVPPLEKKIDKDNLNHKRRTLCISSQIGCSLNCTFCATGTLPFKGNLPVWAILDQVYQFIKKRPNEILTNIVFMGMGEPFYNYEKVIQAAHILHHPLGLNLGAKHITISTAGVVPQIEKFIINREPFNLAISLNHTNNVGRDEIMDINSKHNLKELLYVANQYVHILKRRITFEYVMIKNVNMGSQNIKELLSIAKSLGSFCRINLIPLNTKLKDYQRPSSEEALAFQRALLKGGVRVFNRGSPGIDINAACGMLALKV